MPAPVNKKTALETIAAEVIAQGGTEAEAPAMAEGLLGGLTIGYGMDPSAFLAMHGERLAHLTRQSLGAVGREVTAAPGEMPRNV